MEQLRHLRVEVAWVTPGQQIVRSVEVPAGATLADAVRLSGWLPEGPGIDTDVMPLGVFGRRRSADEQVCDGDRVELYRALAIDPKQARRERAASHRLKRADK